MALSCVSRLSVEGQIRTRDSLKGGKVSFWLRSALRQNLALLPCNMGSQFPPPLPNGRPSSSSLGLRGKGNGEVLDV